MKEREAKKLKRQWGRTLAGVPAVNSVGMSELSTDRGPLILESSGVEQVRRGQRRGFDHPARVRRRLETMEGGLTGECDRPQSSRAP
jgi:hypothetical protein